MHRYKNYEGFLGTEDPLRLQPSTDSWLPLARDIRVRLGRKGYLLDKYLGYVFAGLGHLSAVGAAADGDKAATLLWNAIRYAMEGDEEQGKKNALYPQAKEYIKSHPLPWQEELTRHNIYYVALANLLPVLQLSEYIHHARPRTEEFEIVRVRELYREIGKLLDDFEAMELLAERIHTCFQVTDPAHIFLQGTVDALLFSLTWRDAETSRQVFQLLLEQAEEGTP